MQKLFLIAAALALVGCNYVSIKDGKIPAEYLPQAKAYAGTYSGQFNGRAGRLVISIRNQMVYATFQDARSNDILGESCRSSIGRLTGASISSDKKRVKAVYLAFNPGRCAAEGRSLELHVQRDNSLEARIVESSYVVPGGEQCFGGGGPDFDRICHTTPDTTHYNYFLGTFRK